MSLKKTGQNNKRHNLDISFSTCEEPTSRSWPNKTIIGLRQTKPNKPNLTFQGVGKYADYKGI